MGDVKDEWEFGYSMFKPKKNFHLHHLRKIGKKPESKKVKLYHPFTFEIPKDRFLPDINFYGFSLKELKRSEWSMLAELSFESETIRLLLNASSNIAKSQGLYAFLHYVQDSIIRKKDKTGIKPDPKNFFLRTTSATAKSLQDIASYLIPFKTHYFLVPDNSILRLDWKNILNDNQNYHVFGTYWIDDLKIKEFTILALFNAILRNKKYAKKPILIVIPEIRYLVPFKPEGYKKFLAHGIKSNISVMRNMGKGFSGLFDSQIWNDVDEDVRNSSTMTLYGELGGAGDIEKLSKAMTYKRDTRDLLKKMDYKNSYLIQGFEDQGSFTLFFPSHCHCEPEYNFFEMYKKEFPGKMMMYNNLINTIEEQFIKEENYFKEKIKRQERDIKEEKERKEEIKMAKKEGKEEELKEKVKVMEQKSKEELMKRVYELKEQGFSNSEIKKELGIGSHNTIRKYYEKIKDEIQ